MSKDWKEEYKKLKAKYDRLENLYLKALKFYVETLDEMKSIDECEISNSIEITNESGEDIW